MIVSENFIGPLINYDSTSAGGGKGENDVLMQQHMFDKICVTSITTLFRLIKNK